VIKIIEIQFEICKKELQTRLGSKSMLFPLVLTFAIPIFVFLPQIYQMFSSPKEETKFISLIFFLIIPVMITNTIGINTFINEIRWKTIKTLLVAPIDVGEIFLGKCLACVVVGVVTDLLLSFSLLIWGIEINFSIFVLFFCLGPLIVVYTTFLLVIGTLKFPKIAETGAGVYFSIGGLLFIFFLLFLLYLVLNESQFYFDILSIFVMSILSFITYFSAKKLFNKEKLVLSW
jgi:ABC-type transport system involved in multi-copper enzyme maturation permease subunit